MYFKVLTFLILLGFKYNRFFLNFIHFINYMIQKFLKVALLFLIVCSKELIVFNEEILILLAFSFFIYLVSSKAGMRVIL